MTRAASRLAGCLLLVGCGASPEEPDAVARGRELFASRALSSSSLNAYRCSTCHDGAATGATKPGAALAGATLRPTFWGGAENDLLRSIEACRRSFMHASTPLAAEDADAGALYAYLASLEPGEPDPVPFTPVRDIADVPRGDAVRGALAYTSACSGCHGAMHTAEGRLSPRVPLLPEAALEAHPAPSYSPRTQRLVFIEKTRHGVFLGYGGDMPPFSSEALPDAVLADVLEALGVLGS